MGKSSKLINSEEIVKKKILKIKEELVLNTGERFLPVSSVGIRTTKTTELFRQDITIQTQ